MIGGEHIVDINQIKMLLSGRLKMKDGYTMLTDVALKEKFIQAMLSYNTPWLKTGLHVVLGHGALLVPDKLECPFDCTTQQNAEEENETQNTVLRWIIEKHFMTHPGLAKHHATNKLVFLTCSSFFFRDVLPKHILVENVELQEN